MDSEYSFLISDSYTPRTIPMERLAEYMLALAKLLGEGGSVHFSEIRESSVGLIALVEPAAQPKVRERVQSLRSNTAPAEVLKAYNDLDGMLRRDNAYGSLQSGDAVADIIPFPGRKRPEPVVYGPFKQDGTLDGQLYRIGGKDESKHVHIRDGRHEYSVLTTNEEVALRLRHHLFGATLRFHGTGTWYRHADGSWELKAFKIRDFEELDDAPLEEIVRRLRAVKGSALGAIPEPVRRLLEDRHGNGEVH